MIQLRCTKCKGTNVHIVMWVNPNTRQIIEDFGSFDEKATKWCDDCNKYLLLEEHEPREVTREYLKKLRDQEAPLERHPFLGWCGHSMGKYLGRERQYLCGERQYQTYSGVVCCFGHQAHTLERDPRT